MAHGGSRDGAGRKKGAATKLNEKAREQALDGGITPLQFMLERLRDTSADYTDRMDAAKAAAPYVHAKLASVEVTGDPENPLHSVFKVELAPMKNDDSKD